MRLVCIALAATVLGPGCKRILGIESGVVGDQDASIDGLFADAAIDSSIDVPVPDARTCFGTFQQICLTEDVPDELHVTFATFIDDFIGCTEKQTVGGVDVCIRSARTITVDAGAQISTTGSRFVVLVATESMTISGTLSTWNAGSTACATDQGIFAGGGPGGSFGALGGVGSGQIIDTQPIPPPSAITTFRRGCPGSMGGSDAQGGDGGPGGSGIFLVSPSIHLTSSARINASGHGGDGGNNDRGGGGGGSGGLVLFDSDALQIDSGAIVIAVGGGGGGGGGGGQAEPGGRASAAIPIAGGVGGAGNAGASGDGGDGGTTGDGMTSERGMNGRGSGGGGGSTGVIFVTSTAPAINGTVVPAPRAPTP